MTTSLHVCAIVSSLESKYHALLHRATELLTVITLLAMLNTLKIAP